MSCAVLLEQIDKSTGVAKGLKWDGANLRWVKNSNAYFVAIVQPKSGVAYTVVQAIHVLARTSMLTDIKLHPQIQVWPVVHAYLTDKKLKSIDAEKVDPKLTLPNETAWDALGGFHAAN